MRITSKGQVTIPQEIRNRLGLLPHTKVGVRIGRQSRAHSKRLADRHFSIDDRITPLVLNRVNCSIRWSVI